MEIRKSINAVISMVLVAACLHLSLPTRAIYHQLTSLITASNDSGSRDDQEQPIGEESQEQDDRDDKDDRDEKDERDEKEERESKGFEKEYLLTHVGSLSMTDIGKRWRTRDIALLNARILDILVPPPQVQA